MSARLADPAEVDLRLSDLACEFQNFRRSLLARDPAR
jgi:hypothetical protein